MGASTNERPSGTNSFRKSAFHCIRNMSKDIFAHFSFNVARLEHASLSRSVFKGLHMLLHCQSMT